MLYNCSFYSLIITSYLKESAKSSITVDLLIILNWVSGALKCIIICELAQWLSNLLTRDLFNCKITLENNQHTSANYSNIQIITYMCKLIFWIFVWFIIPDRTLYGPSWQYIYSIKAHLFLHYWGLDWTHSNELTV